MKVFYNSWLAKKVLAARCNRVMLFGFCFTKEDYLTPEEINHEKIHVRQWIECMIIGILICLLCLVSGFSWWFLFFILILYYILYGIGFLVRLIVSHNAEIAYKNISFEKEAYRNEDNLLYLKYKNVLTFLKYIFMCLD